MYEWPTKQPQTPLALATSVSSSLDWYHRLGHPAFNVLQKISSLFSPVFFCLNSQNLHCNSCSINKNHKLPFHDTSISSSQPLQIIFSDVWSSPVHSFDGYKYYLIIVDPFTRYIWFFPLKLKSQVTATFVKFKQLVENQLNTKIKTFYTDNGGEFITLRSFLANQGISHLTTPPHTPEHNGLAERRHRHIVETGLSLLTHASVPTEYWTYAFATAVYLINRMPSKTLDMDSPYLRLFGTSPNYSKLRVFGCLCYPWLRPYTANKLEPRSTPCVFFGYSLTQSAFLCFDPVSSRLFVSRHVHFVERQFPFPSLTASSLPPTDSQEVPWTPSVVPIIPASGVQNSSPPVDHSPPVEPALPPPAPPATTQSQPSTEHRMVTHSQNQIVKLNPRYCLSATLAPNLEPHTI